jgi:hypothetical protein
LGMCVRYLRRSDKRRIAESYRVGNLDELVLEAHAGWLCCFASGHTF